MSGINCLLDTKDAIIYAIALANECELVTANVKDFKNIGQGVEIYNPV